MNKEIKDAVSVIIKNENGETLFALRNKSEKSFPLVWSLPSHFVKTGESVDETVRRIGKNKLGVELTTVRLVNEGKAERDDFIIFMHDYEAKVISGRPHITTEDPYEEIKWQDAESQLASMTVMGDCCRLYKESLGL